MYHSAPKTYISYGLCLLLILLSVTAKAEVRLPRLVGNGMVLQRERPVPIWGWANKNETVVLQFQGQSYKTKANRQGEWKIELPAQPAGGPHSMQINQIVIQDILFGDVWLCSGQSNMELPISRVLDLYRDEVRDLHNDQIRLFHVPLRYHFRQGETDLEGGEWKSVTPQNILNFSATAYFFAADLYEKYQVPIGLLRSAVGGSPIEAWMSPEALANYPNHLAAAAQCSPGYVDSLSRAEQQRSNLWFSTLNSKDLGVNQWNLPHIDVSDWSHISLPGYWADKGLGQVIGSLWLRKDIDIPAALAGKPAVLRLGCIVDSDSSFVNGQFVGNITYQYPPRVYTVPAGLLKAGKNNITVRVVCNSPQGGFVEEKPYQLIVDGQVFDLSGDWLYKTGATMPPAPSQTFFQYKPLGLYNAMIHPLLPYALKGVIWYQGESNTGDSEGHPDAAHAAQGVLGESNTGRSHKYAQLFPLMIQDWRAKWNQPDLPFIYVQLANFMKTQPSPVESNWAALREAQRQTLSLPHTGMAVTIDIGEWNDIHPLNKKEVGRRLSLEAQRVAYGDSLVVSSGPRLESVGTEDNSLILSFSSTGSGLDANSLLQGFALAGEDGNFIWARAVVINHNTVKVWHPDINKPITVRYAWADNPVHANLRNKEGLPASPFTAKP
jgi:Domain of unknown function (DUF303).